jgi:alpha-N-arabinofuranosidase
MRTTTALRRFVPPLVAAMCQVLLLEVADAQSPCTTIRVDLKQKKAPVPSTLYGIFMEEISHAFDGGIYAELIQNRSFEEGVLPPGMKLVKKPDGGLKMELDKLPPDVPREKRDMPWPWHNNCGWDPARELVGWSLENRGGATGEMKITEANPMNAASSRSLAVKVGEPADQSGGVALKNSGYWGIDVRSGTGYDLKWYLRAGSFEGSVTATLESGDGKVLGRHDFGRIAPDDHWRRLTAKITATGTDAKAQLVLSFRGKGELQVDWVSLFPPTYKNRPNGLRPDLAKYLEDMKPSFVRYPGGCYVQGLSWESAPDWRTMVCPPEDRPGQWGYWQYRSTDGFGYHEFLQFCEDIGSDAMYVAFCGMTVHPDNNMPLDRIDPVIRQTLDAIEYATGPVTSKWGAVRAKMGHPKPFPLKYIEIGNEHPPAVYGDYYAKFRAAIKNEYPDMIVIMSMFWSGLNQAAIDRAGDSNIDVVDEHSYKPSGWIRNNFDYFDKYPRKPWKVYVGEYAHHHGTGDWSAAMDDSVYLMMLERNGDLVTMASYAPLFVNVNQRSWGVNLIEFDSARSFVHSSYHVQKAYAESRPDVNLATAVEVLPNPDPQQPLFAGRFGLGSWSTVNEFKEFRIHDESGKVVFSDDFENLSQWDGPGIGQWEAENGVLKQSDPNRGPTSLFLKQPLKTGRITVKARRVGGTEGFLMLFNADGPERFMFCNYGAAGNKFSAIQGSPADGIATTGGGDLQGSIEDNRWYDISLVVTSKSAEMLLDGKRVSRMEANALPSFFATAGYRNVDGTVMVRATNYKAEPVSARIRLDGTSQVAATGQHLVIRANKPGDENSLDNPDLITPRVLPLTGCSNDFQVTLPPHSVNILRIPAK